MPRLNLCAIYHFLFPLAHAEYDNGHDHAQCPGDHQTSEQGDGVAVGEGIAAGQVGQTVSHGDTDENAE